MIAQPVEWSYWARGEDKAGGVARDDVGTGGAFHDLPTVVAAPHDDVHFLPRPAPDVARPDQAAVRVERKTPGVAEAVRPDLVRAAAWPVRERIVRRNVVAGVVRVYAQDRPQEVRCVRVVVVLTVVAAALT